MKAIALIIGMALLVAIVFYGDWSNGTGNSIASAVQSDERPGQGRAPPRQSSSLSTDSAEPSHPTNADGDTWQLPEASFLTLARDPEAIDLMLHHGGTPTDADIDLYNLYHILPFNPTAAYECRQQSANFVLDETTPCDVEKERLPHPYFALDEQELADRADYDEVAALVLAKRSRTDPEAGKQWTLRAVALSGKSGPLMSFADSRAAKYFQRDMETGGRKPAYRLEELSDRYVMNEIARRMGDPRARADHWRTKLEVHGGFERLSALEKQVDQLLMELGQVQLSAKGVNNFEGLAEAASKT